MGSVRRNTFSPRKVNLFLILAITLVLYALFPTMHINQYKVVRTLEGSGSPKPTARLAMICCGDRYNEALILLKSAFLFSQDADLKIFIIADETCGHVMAEEVEFLQFRARAWKGKFDVKFIPHKVPPGTEKWQVPKQWKCSITRLFLHKILPKTDAVLYLDTDHVFLSNVTQVWEYFEGQQRQNPFAVVSLADHVPSSSKYGHDHISIPFAGNWINSGTIFMNLTRMREFRFDELVIETRGKYKHKTVSGPDQDILNAVFGTHKGNATIMECSYSFHPEHCGAYNGERYNCNFHSMADGPVCFCWPVLTTGVKLVHAYGQTFRKHGLWRSLWEAMEKVPLNSVAALQSIQALKEDFRKLPKQPQCFSLTPEVLYRNAEEYLLNMIGGSSE